MRRLSWLVVAGALAGCGALDKLTTLTFQLPSQSFSVSTGDSQWRSAPQWFSSDPIDCASPGDCCRPRDGLSVSCTQYPFTCVTGACAIEFPVELIAVVDLARDARALAQARGQVPAELTLTSIEYTVKSALNVALPEVTLYVAPADVATGTDRRARLLGVVPTTNAGLQASGTIALTPAASQAFTVAARDVRSPFNLIASTRIRIVSGGATPTGWVDLSVTGKITAKF
jgi:hypothetical protein